MNNNLKQEVINLLPWYHLGKLTDDENALVEEAITNDPSLKEASLAEQQMMSEVQADKNLLDGSIFDGSTSRLDSVLAKLDQLEQPAPPAEPKKRSAVVQKPSIFEQIKDYFDNLLSGNSRSFTYAVFAALTVVQLALLVLFIVPSDNMPQGEGSSYGLASYSEQTEQAAVQPKPASTSQMTLLIGMNSHFKAEGFNEILGSKVDAELMPDSDGFYRIRLDKKLSAREIEDLEHELSKKHGKIWFIGEESSQ
jgi:hypothetical protein